MEENYLALLLCILTDASPTEAVEYLKGIRKKIQVNKITECNYQLEISDLLGEFGYEESLF